jgi:hypothetical protein
MMRINRELLRDAQALAGLANLDPKDIEYFQHNFRVGSQDFVPSKFWEPWEPWRPSLQSDREKGVLPAEFSDYLDKPGIPVWRTVQNCLQKAWREHFPLTLCIQLISAGNVFGRLDDPVPWYELGFERFLTADTWPYQRAVMFLGTESWRARRCLQCEKVFVAVKANQHYCRDRCFQTSRKETKRIWASESRKRRT